MLFDTKSDANYCADPVSADTYAKRIKVAAQFCAERHSIYLKKVKGLTALGLKTQFFVLIGSVTYTASWIR